jgi:hypothetical protein
MNREVDYSSLMLRVEGLVIAASIGLIGGLELGSLWRYGHKCWEAKQKAYLLLIMECK